MIRLLVIGSIFLSYFISFGQENEAILKYPPVFAHNKNHNEKIHWDEKAHHYESGNRKQSLYSDFFDNGFEVHSTHNKTHLWNLSMMLKSISVNGKEYSVSEPKNMEQVENKLTLFYDFLSIEYLSDKHGVTQSYTFTNLPEEFKENANEIIINIDFSGDLIALKKGKSKVEFVKKDKLSRESLVHLALMDVQASDAMGKEMKTKVTTNETNELKFIISLQKPTFPLVVHPISGMID